MEQDQLDEPVECDSCGWKTTELRAGGTIGEDTLAFCDICYNTFAANTVLYPESYRDSAPIMQMIAWCANRVLAEIKGQGVGQG